MLSCKKYRKKLMRSPSPTFNAKVVPPSSLFKSWTRTRTTEKKSRQSWGVCYISTATACHSLRGSCRCLLHIPLYSPKLAPDQRDSNLTACLSTDVKISGPKLKTFSTATSFNRVCNSEWTLRVQGGVVFPVHGSSNVKNSNRHCCRRHYTINLHCPLCGRCRIRSALSISTSQGWSQCLRQSERQE